MLLARVAQLPTRGAELGPPARKKAKLEEGACQDGDQTSRNDTTVQNGYAAEERCRKDASVTKPLGPAAVQQMSAGFLQPVRGDMQYLVDKSGVRYLDTANNVAHVGHCHPAVVAAGAAQMAELNTNTRFLHDRMITYAKKLTATLPEKLSMCIFTNSGSEANDLAVQIAEVVTRKKLFVSLAGGYHGHLKSLRHLGDPENPLSADSPTSTATPTCVVPLPDVYRGSHREVDTAGQLYAKDLSEVIEREQAKGTGIAGFIHQSVLSSAGVVYLPDGFLESAYRAVREAGGLCIADEVECGFGRVGDAFWGFELQGVCPDIVTMGKPMGNGHPVAAVVTSREIADKFAESGANYFNTFGGNPVSMAIAESVLTVIQGEGLQERARATGSSLLSQLRQLQKKHQCVGDVRGRGLLIGVEFVLDRERREPAKTLADDVVVRLLEDYHIICSTCGVHGNVLQIMPPLCFSLENVQQLVSSLDSVLSAMADE